jgi:hypothetical protein
MEKSIVVQIILENMCNKLKSQKGPYTDDSDVESQVYAETFELQQDRANIGMVSNEPWWSEIVAESM